MSSSWPRVPLRAVLSSVARPEVVDPEKTYRILGAHWYAHGLYTKDTLTGGEIQALKVYRVEKGDFVYNRLFAWKGSFAVASGENHGCYVSNEFPCFRAIGDRIDLHYLWRYFSRESAWTEALGLSTGGTPTSRNRLKEEAFLQLEIPLPPLTEQRQLVERIDALAAKIDEAKRLRAMAQTESVALINAARRQLIGDSPREDWIPLGSIVKHLENGWSPACESRQVTNHEWGVLKVGAVSFGKYDAKENKALPPGLSPRPEYEVRVGDFLMSRANTFELVGACALVEQTPSRLMLSDKLFRFHFRDKTDVDKYYLDHVLKSPALRYQIIKAASGTSPTMKNISKEKVLALLIPGHSPAIQKKLALMLNGIQKQTEAASRIQSQTGNELEAVLPTILDQAFRGKLR
jgi:type I restriction enzyme, S subunit